MNIKEQKAFTLIELLLVSSIVSLLSTVVVNASKEYRVKAQDSHMKTESHELTNAINLYKNEHDGKVPLGDEHKNNRRNEIVKENDPDDNGLAYRSSMKKLVDGGYIPEIPASPSGKSYAYHIMLVLMKKMLCFL